ncbi:MAG TPA: response regulator [Kofleriaceae bacterium]|nr:response regulator [Kofleriaceae bacterium]
MSASGPVLVVEDDRDVRESLVAVLEDAGYKVISASDGRAALALLRAGPLPSVILLDLMMPVMDGFEFRAEQKRDPSMAAIPVVVFTAGWYPVEVGGRLEADGYLTKPIRVEALLELVSRFQ